MLLKKILLHFGSVFSVHISFISQNVCADVYEMWYTFFLQPVKVKGSWAFLICNYDFFDFHISYMYTL